MPQLGRDRERRCTVAVHKEKRTKLKTAINYLLISMQN